jgi:hypothetical protein
VVKDGKFVGPTRTANAVFALNAHETEVEEIRSGFRVRPPKDRTFKELCTKWIEVRAAVKRQPKKDESIINAHLKPAFEELTLRQVTAEKIAEFSTELMAKRAPQTCRNILNLLGAMFNQSVEWWQGLGQSPSGGLRGVLGSVELRRIGLRYALRGRVGGTERPPKQVESMSRPVFGRTSPTVSETRVASDKKPYGVRLRVQA